MTSLSTAPGTLIMINQEVLPPWGSESESFHERVALDNRSEDIIQEVGYRSEDIFQIMLTDPVRRMRSNT